MKKLILAILLSVCLFSQTLSAKILSLNEISQAAARVGRTGSFGSATCCHIDDNYVYLLSNAHVVSRSRSVNIEFYQNGYKSEPIPGNVIWRKYVNASDIDLAVIAVNRNRLNFTPRIIPFAPPDHSVKPNDYISSVGCPRAWWAMGFEGRVVRTERGRILFKPPSISGQSGSALCININNDTYIGGVITWRLNNIGGAIPISTLHKLLTRSHYTPAKIPTYYQQVNHKVNSDMARPQKLLYRQKQYQIIQGRKALGINGKYYPLYYDSDWQLRAILDHGETNIQILNWAVDTTVGLWPILPGPGSLPDISPFRRRNPDQNPGIPDRGPDGSQDRNPRPLPNPNPGISPGLPPGFGLPPGEQPQQPNNPTIPTKPSLQQQLEALTEENAGLTKQLKEINDIIKTLEETIAKSEVELEQLKLDKATLESTVEDGKKGLEDTKTKNVEQIVILNNTISERTTRIVELTKILDTTIADAEGLNHIIMDKDYKITELVLKTGKLTTEVNNTQVTVNKQAENNNILVFWRNAYAGGSLLGILGIISMWLKRRKWGIFSLIGKLLSKRYLQPPPQVPGDGLDPQQQPPPSPPPVRPKSNLPKYKYEPPPPPLFTSHNPDKTTETPSHIVDNSILQAILNKLEEVMSKIQPQQVSETIKQSTLQPTLQPTTQPVPQPENPFDHPNYVQPPPIIDMPKPTYQYVQPTQEERKTTFQPESQPESQPTSQPISEPTPKSTSEPIPQIIPEPLPVQSSQPQQPPNLHVPPPPQMPTGLGPVPNYWPTQRYTSAQLWEAVVEIARRHPNEPLLQSVPSLVQQIIESPRSALR